MGCCASLADSSVIDSGQVIASQGDANRQDITALGALIAGTFASSREVAKLLEGEHVRVESTAPNPVAATSNRCGAAACRKSRRPRSRFRRHP